MPPEMLQGTAIETAAPGAGVTVVKGEWPGVRIARGNSAAAAGPTGVAWVDSNGWLARLTAARHPGDAIWIDAAPRNGAYLTAMADAAAHGARWYISLAEPPTPAAWQQIA